MEHFRFMHWKQICFFRIFITPFSVSLSQNLNYSVSVMPRLTLRAFQNDDQCEITI
jgi:hypothetical protein